MKTKFFTLLALCMCLSVDVAKAAFGEWNFTVASKAPNGYFGSSPSLCTYQVVTDGISATKFGRFTRPSTAALTDGLQWGAVDRTLAVQYQVASIPGGNVAMGTAKNTTYNEYLIVRMRKYTGGSPQVNFYSSSQSVTITSATTVVIGEWVSYLFDFTTNAGTNFKMFTVIPDGTNKACVTDILDCTFTNSPIAISVSSNSLTMGTVTGNGTYAVIEGTAYLVATPKAGYRFVNWTEGGVAVSGAGASYSFTVSTARTLVANFAAGYNIYATATGGTISGLATNGSYNSGDAVSLTATATGSNRFIGWIENGSIVSTSLSLSFTASSNRNLVAMFAAAGNYTSAAPSQLFYEYGTTGGGTPANGTLGSIAIDYVGLTDNVSIVPPTNYEISLSNSPFVATNPITLTPSSGNVPYTTIYVHLKEVLAAGTYNQTLPITSTGMTQVNLSLTGAVNKKNVYINSPILKTYDGTLVATVSGAYGVVGSDAVSITGTFGSAGYTGTVTQPTGGLTGAQSANYQIGSILWGKVVTAPLTITGITGVDKYYDGNSTATLGGTASYSGMQNSESFTITGTPAATFANASVANNKSITVTGYTTPSTNYSISQPTGLTANITAKPLTLPDAAATSKVYDGTNSALITGTLTGKVGSDIVTLVGTGTFASTNVSSAIAVTSTSTLTGASAGNYSLTQPTGLLANITPLGLTITSPTATSKSYDGNANITVSGTLATPIGGDDVSLNTTGTVPDANVGAGKTVTLALTGTKSGNYSLTQPSPTLTANINAIPLTISATDLWSNSANWSSVPNAGTDITVTSGELTIDQNPAVHSITVNSGAKLTLNNGNTLSTGKISLQNTATYVDKNTYTVDNPAPTVNAAVSQTLTSGRNWYVSSPITTSTGLASQLSTATSVVGYNETTGLWDTQTGALTAGKGYISVTTKTDGDIAFNGTLNTGDVSVILTRSGTNASKPGFNLVGNPYPSYINWTEATANAANVLTTIWYRTKDAGQYTFYTYNPVSDIAAPSTPGITSYIPPMQAFWVRVKDSNGGTLKFTNTMREHDLSGGTNLLKAPATNKILQQVLRLQVSNGTNSDEAIVLFNPNASDGFDAYDSPKMSNANPAIPEIYTTVGTENLVINGLSSINTNQNITLGFTPGASNNNFSIKATQVSNFDAGTRIILKDNETGIEQDITDGSAYNFASGSAPTSTRFSVLFKSVSLTTGIGKMASDNENNEGSMFIYRNENNQIVVNHSKMTGQEGIVAVCNMMGQKLFSTSTRGTITLIDMTYFSGVYLVTVTTGNKQFTKKIILN